MQERRIKWQSSVDIASIFPIILALSPFHIILDPLEMFGHPRENPWLVEIGAAFSPTHNPKEIRSSLTAILPRKPLVERSPTITCAKNKQVRAWIYSFYRSDPGKSRCRRGKKGTWTPRSRASPWPSPPGWTGSSAWPSWWPAGTWRRSCMPSSSLCRAPLWSWPLEPGRSHCTGYSSECPVSFPDIKVTSLHHRWLVTGVTCNCLAGAGPCWSAHQGLGVNFRGDSFAFVFVYCQRFIS